MAKGKFEKSRVPVATQMQAKATEKKSHALRNTLIICGVVLVVAAAAVLGWLYLGRDQTIAKNVYIAGVNVGGMSKEEAITAVQAVMDETYGSNDMVVKLHLSEQPKDLIKATIEETEIPTDLSEFFVAASAPEVDPDQLEVDPDSVTPEVETEPTDLPQNPDDPEQEADTQDDEKTLVFKPTDVDLKLDVTAAVESAYAIGRGTFGVTAPKERRDVDISKYLTIDETYIRSLVDQAATEINSTYVDTSVKEGTTEIEVPVKQTSDDNTDDDDDAENGDQAPKTEKKTVDALEITVGSFGIQLDAEDVLRQILDAYDVANFELTYTVQVEAPEVIDLDALLEKYGKEAKNASFDKDSYEIIPEVAGYGFDKAKVYDELLAAKPGETVVVPLTDVEPPITAELLDSRLFSDVLSSYDSPHTAIPDRTRNLELACEAINGTIIKPGNEFSFNNIVGERTPDKGYRPATAYVAGGESKEEYGGGVCQVASTLYMCALQADLEITERTEHMYRVTYVPDGLDATIYWGSLDFRFRNNTAYPIRIDASVSGGYVHIQFIGTETKDYKVKLYSVCTGTSDDGTEYASYMQKYDLNGNLISEELIDTSSYMFHKQQTNDTPDPTEPPTTEPTEEPTEPSTAKPTETDPPETDPPETDPPETDPPETDPTTEATEETPASSDEDPIPDPPDEETP